MKKHRLKLIAVVVAVSICGLLYGLYQSLWYGTLSLDGLESYETIRLNNNVYAAKAVDGDLRLKPGNYVLEAFGPRQEPYRTEVKIGAFSNTKQTLTSEVVPESSMFSFVSRGKIPDGYAISGGTLLENDYWAVLFIAPSNGFGEGWVDIYRFGGRNWELVESGTGFDETYLSSLGYPASIQRYLETANE